MMLSSDNALWLRNVDEEVRQLKLLLNTYSSSHIQNALHSLADMLNHASIAIHEIEENVFHPKDNK